MSKSVKVGPSIIFDKNPDRPDPTEEQKAQSLALVQQLRKYPGSVIHNVEVKDGKIYGQSKMSILTDSIIRGNSPTEEPEEEQPKRSKTRKLLNVAFAAANITLAVIEGYNLYTLIKELKQNGNRDNI